MSEGALNRQLVLAVRDTQPGHHRTFHFLGLTFNTDTMIGTGVAGVIVLGAGLYMARRATAARPSKLQLLFEMLIEWIQDQVDEQMGVRAPRGVVPLCVATFAFILIANWLAVLPRANSTLASSGCKLSACSNWAIASACRPWDDSFTPWA